jgi:ABC-type nitrate/sulfonate/bicarbonate transport system substrate-binding protein
LRNNLTRSTVASFLAVTALGLILGGNARAADANTLRYGIDDEQNINRLPQVIAEREGLFAREGLTVELVRFTSTFRTRQASQNPAAAANPTSVRDGMAKGTIDMARQQLPLLINDAMAGGKSVGVSVTASNPVYFVVARPEIKSFADLKGKTLTITNPHDGITIWTRKLLALHGLKNEDVTLKNIAGSDARFACLNSGECAAATLDQPAIFKGLDAGHHALGITNEIGPRLYQVDIVNPTWAAAHRDTVVKYIRATTAAMRFIQDPKNRDEVVKVTAAFTKEPEDRSRQMLGYVWDPKNRVFEGSAPDMNAVRAAISFLGEYEVLKQPLPAAERFVDNSYAKAAGL